MTAPDCMAHTATSDLPGMSRTVIVVAPTAVPALRTVLNRLWFASNQQIGLAGTAYALFCATTACMCARCDPVPVSGGLMATEVPCSGMFHAMCLYVTA